MIWATQALRDRYEISIVFLSAVLFTTVIGALVLMCVMTANPES